MHKEIYAKKRQNTVDRLLHYAAATIWDVDN